MPKEIERDFLDFGGIVIANDTPDFKDCSPHLQDEIQRRLERVVMS